MYLFIVIMIIIYVLIHYYFLEGGRGEHSSPGNSGKRKSRRLPTGPALTVAGGSFRISESSLATRFNVFAMAMVQNKDAEKFTKKTSLFFPFPFFQRRASGGPESVNWAVGWGRWVWEGEGEEIIVWKEGDAQL